MLRFSFILVLFSIRILNQLLDLLIEQTFSTFLTRFILIQILRLDSGWCKSTWRNHWLNLMTNDLRYVHRTTSTS